MTNEEVNKFIHTEILGKCWHDMKDMYHRDVDMIVPTCSRCGIHAFPFDDDNPDYCSSSTPRGELDNVVAKVVKKTSLETYARVLIQVREGLDAPYEDDGLTHWKPFDLGYLATTSPDQIARACVNAFKGEK